MGLPVDDNMHASILHHHALRREHVLDLVVPMRTRAPNAPWVFVWNRRRRRQRVSCQSRGDHMHDALPIIEKREVHLRAEFSYWRRAFDLKREMGLDPLVPIFGGVLDRPAKQIPAHGFRPASERIFI